MNKEPGFDVDGQINYWRNLAVKDFQFAERVLAHDPETLYALFFVHLALEKILKAYVAKRIKDFPPRNHNLLFLAEMGGVELSQDQTDFCAKINVYNIEARYPGVLVPPPTLEKAKEYLAQAKELFEWLTRKL